MKWDNKCLNVWLGGAKVNDSFYNCRITDTGGGVVLLIQKDGLVMVKETYQSSVDEVKQLAENYLQNVKN